MFARSYSDVAAGISSLAKPAERTTSGIGDIVNDTMSASFPTIGSQGHATASCKPCAFFHTRGCAKGVDCQFCHLCDADEKKRRQKAKRMGLQQEQQERLPRGVGEASEGNAVTKSDGLVQDPRTTQQPAYFLRRPKHLTLPEELASSYIVRNTFIEAPPAVHPSPSICVGRMVASCPASKIGEIQLEAETVFGDADTASCDFSSSAMDSPGSAASMLWPATPDAPIYQERTLPMQAFPFMASTFQTDGATVCRPVMQLGDVALLANMDVSIAMLDEHASDQQFSEWPRSPQPGMLSQHWLPDLSASMQMQTCPHPASVDDCGLDPLTSSDTKEAFDFCSPCIDFCSPCTLSLADMIEHSDGAAASSTRTPSTFPSVGSMQHAMGNCKPCGFFHKNGCKAGVDCTFCHLCDSGEKKRRQREKREMLRCGDQGKAACASY